MNAFRLAGFLMPLSLVLPARGSAQAPPDSARLTLTAAVARALAVYPTLAAARATARGAHATVAQLSGARWPQVATQAALSRFQDPMIVAPLHGLNLQAAPPAFDKTLLQGGVSATYTLFDGGARGAGIHGARARAGAADDAVSASEADIIAETARSYLDVLTANAVLAAQKEGVTALTAERNRVRQQLDVGGAARVDLLRVEAALATAQAGRIAARTALDDAERGLARRLGTAPEGARAPRLVMVRLADTTPPSREAMRTRAEHANPQLKAVRSQVDAASWTRRAAAARWLPQLDVVAGYLVYGSGAGDFTGEWQGGLKLTYPIFTGGARAGAIAEAGANADAIRARLGALQLQTADAVDRAVSAVHDAAARTAAVQAAVTQLDEAVRIERLALDTGAGTETDFLQSEAALRAARANLAQTREAEVLARVALARLTGDLTPTWIHDALETDR